MRPKAGDGRGKNRLLALSVWTLIWLVLANLAAEVLAVYCWQPYTCPRETARLTSAWTDFSDCEVLLVGSSLVEFGLAPAVIRSEVRQQLGLDICVLNLGHRGMSSQSAVSYLRAVLSRSTPRILIWGTSPQECMYSNSFNYLRTYASPSEAVRTLWDVPGSYPGAKRAVTACFRPPGLIFQGGMLASAYLLKRFLNLAPLRFQTELEWTRRHGGWFPKTIAAGGSRMGWGSAVQWRSIRELTQLAERHDLSLAVLLMPIHDEVVPKEIPIRRRFSVELAEYCRREGIPYFDLLEPPQPVLAEEDFMNDGRHLLVRGAHRLSRHVSRRVIIPMLMEQDAER